MKLEMENIDYFNNSAQIINNKLPKSIISWITVLIIIFFLTIIGINIPYNKYITYQSQVISIDGKNYIRIDKVEAPINTNNKLYINYKEYLYKVKEINDSYIIIDIDIPKELNYEGNIINIEIEKTKTTIYKNIRKRIKKGLNI